MFIIVKASVTIYIVLSALQKPRELTLSKHQWHGKTFNREKPDSSGETLMLGIDEGGVLEFVRV